MASIPSTMKAIQCAKPGGAEVLEYKEDVPVPELKEGQVLVKNEYSGVNYLDTYFRSGMYPAHFPLITGNEASGVIAAVHSSVKDLKQGDRVVYLDHGTYAQYRAVDAARITLIPDAMSTQEACSMYHQGLTALCFIRESANVQPGQWVLVHAAAGGVGLMLVQMISRAVGAKVIGTASTKEKCELAKANGAHYTINNKEEDVAARVKEITDGHGPDKIFDGIGAATFDLNIDMVARKGQIISFGNAVSQKHSQRLRHVPPQYVWLTCCFSKSGAPEPLNILRLGTKNIKLTRPVISGYVNDREDLVKYSKELFDLVLSKKVNIRLHKIYPLKDVVQSHKDLESRTTSGKLLLECQ